MLHISIDIEGETHTGDLLETSLTREGIQLEVAFGPRLAPLPIGADVFCKLEEPQSDSMLEQAGQLLHQTRSGAQVKCGLRFELESPQLLFVLNQRRALRVNPSQTLPVSVRLPSGVKASVHDLSTAGMSLLLLEEAANELPDWKLQLALSLPNEDEELAIACRVRARRLNETSIQYGLEFDERAPGYERWVARIEEYVRLRQRELLEESMQRKSA